MAQLLGIFFPFSKGVSAFPRAATDDDVLQASILQILNTKSNERPMRTSFGNNIWSYVFESDSDTLDTNIEREIRTALGQWEPRISVTGVDIDIDDVNDPGSIIISVYYVSLLTGQSNVVTIAG